MSANILTLLLAVLLAAPCASGQSTFGGIVGVVKDPSQEAVGSAHVTLTSLDDRFSWWARDDRGRWHLAREYGAHFGGGQVDLLVEFAPALHPQTRSLDLLVRGPAGQAAVTLPLRWLASP